MITASPVSNVGDMEPDRTINTSLPNARSPARPDDVIVTATIASVRSPRVRTAPVQKARTQRVNK